MDEKKHLKMALALTNVMQRLQLCIAELKAISDEMKPEFSMKKVFSRWAVILKRIVDEFIIEFESEKDKIIAKQEIVNTDTALQMDGINAKLLQIPKHRRDEAEDFVNDLYEKYHHEQQYIS